MKSRNIVAARKAVSRPPYGRDWQNTMNFPRALRDAIPVLESCWGRCLVLAAITGHAVHGVLSGRRIRIKCEVEETGKLTGRFDVWLDLNPEAARALARTLDRLAGEAEKAPPAGV